MRHPSRLSLLRICVSFDRRDGIGRHRGRGENKLWTGLLPWSVVVFVVVFFVHVRSPREGLTGVGSWGRGAAIGQRVLAVFIVPRVPLAPTCNEFMGWWVGG